MISLPIKSSSAESLDLTYWGPLIFFQVYLCGSLLTYAFGPVERVESANLFFYAYALAGQLAIYIGYRAGINKKPSYSKAKVSWKSFLSAAIFTTLILAPATISIRNSAGISLSEAIANPAEAYNARIELYEEASGTSSYIVLLRVIGSPIIKSLVPLGIVFWPMLSTQRKLVWCLAVLVNIVEALYTGAAIGIFDIALVAPWALWLQKHYQAIAFQQKRVENGSILKDSRTRQPKRKNYLKEFKLAAVTLIIMLVAIQYFSHSRLSRYNVGANEYPLWTTQWSEQEYGIKIPESIEYPIYIVSTYWTNGYNGLSESLQLPYECCYGVGHSTFLMRRVGMLLGDADFFWYRSYPARLELETGYNATGKWHTIYPWLASDVTFTGAIILVGVLAYFYARAWSDCLHGRNVLAISFFCLCSMCFYYLPANNGRLSYPEESVAFWGIFIAWQFTNWLAKDSRGRQKTSFRTKPISLTK